METFEHTLNNLFAQLGLPNTDDDIDTFIQIHAPLPEDISLEEAEFWSNSQSQFIQEAISDDSDWVEVIDQLDVRLRAYRK
jgi:hypothetical protein